MIAAACVVATLAACAGTDEVSGDRRVVGGVSLTFSIRPARVEVGRTVRFALRVTNIQGRKTELRFPTSKQYDFWVTRGRDEIWRWSDGKLFTPAIEKRTVDPQGAITLSEPWTATPAGRYIVHGELQAEGFRRALTGTLRVGD
jgi:hypothetical protein